MNTLWGKVAVLLSSSLAAGLLVNFLAWRATARHEASAAAWPRSGADCWRAVRRPG